MSDIKFEGLQILVVKVVNDVIYDFNDYLLSPCHILSGNENSTFERQNRITTNCQKDRL